MTLALSAAAIIVRAAVGPFHLVLSVRSPLVSEGICALSATLLLLLSPSGEIRTPAPAGRGRMAAVLSITALCLLPLLSFPLVCDEYVQVVLARMMGPETMWQFLTHAGTDHFFRPLADASIGLDRLCAGLGLAGWHLLSLVLHLINTALMFLFSWRLFRSAGAAFWAAALFGIHGTRAESVAFLARFDQLATLFVLGGLLLFDQYLESRRGRLLAASCMVMLCGLLSKESAYVFPLLALWLLAWRGQWTRRRIRDTVPFFAITAATFIYRWNLLGGIGGYSDRATGRPQILNIHVLSLVKALLLRLWSILYFPVNWSEQPEPWLAATMAAALLALFALVLLARTGWRSTGFAVAFTLLASLPVAHMLLIGADLRGAAHVYLPSVGFCLLLGATIDSVGRTVLPSARVAIGAALLVFHAAALHHNNLIWSRTAQLADRECRIIARESALSGKASIVQDPPRILNGIAFFANGLPECVTMKSSTAAAIVEFTPELSSPAVGTPVFVWDDAGQRFDLKRK
jgi:hypothetical protein